MKLHSFIRVVLGFIAISSVATASRVGASVIDFSDQAAGPSGFPSNAAPQTLVYHIDGVTVTFTGGFILTGENGSPTPIDQGNVYATGANTADPSLTLTNPLTITFSEAVQNLAVTVVNGLPGSYSLSDNLGHSDSFSLPTLSNSEATGTLVAPGTTVDVGFSGPPLDTVSFDFAIGQISFDVPAPPAVPEPSTVMLGGGFLAAAVAHFWRRFGK
ncbi:MAG: PEP-CTERM sorting domain-containing protein [Verrucomicrobia bacterium]|nr:PEP-CTERM sorting domain-containing protein [Verrucomicrobiota bacterium]